MPPVTDMFEYLPAGASVAERLEEYSVPEPNSGCWLWLAGADPAGYGVIRIDGKMEKAHRAAYAERNGLIPDNLWVLHRCDTPACINPDHLFLGTNQDNINDKIQKGRMPIGEDCVMAKLTNAQVLSIVYDLENTDFTHTQIGEKYGVARTAISNIKLGEKWARLTKISRDNPVYRPVNRGNTTRRIEQSHH